MIKTRHDAYMDKIIIGDKCKRFVLYLTSLEMIINQGLKQRILFIPLDNY